jgi:ArsR family transcriptional regulator
VKNSLSFGRPGSQRWDKLPPSGGKFNILKSPVIAAPPSCNQLFHDQPIHKLWRRASMRRHIRACNNFIFLLLWNNKTGGSMAVGKKQTEEQVARFADMFSALGTEPRLRIMRLLLSAHPDGMVVGDIIAELGITASTLSHHLEKLKNEDLVKVRRESTFLWYSANADALQELLGFLYAECCTRNKAVEPRAIASLCR